MGNWTHWRGWEVLSNKRSFLEEVAMCPWPVGVGLGFFSFFGLCVIDAWLTNATKLPAGSSPVGIFKLIVPLIFLGTAVVSASNSRNQRQWFQQRSSRPDLNKMTWAEFEIFVGCMLQKEGFNVEARGRASADGGIDLVARRAGQTCLVQCKHWKSRKVGVKTVRELLGVMNSEGADECSVITSSKFTEEARAFARSNPITLVDGRELCARLARLQNEREDQGQDERPKLRLVASNTSERDLAPELQCPKCAANMILRTAKKGARAGSQFWGCSTFPKCWGTQDYEQEPNRATESTKSS